MGAQGQMMGAQGQGMGGQGQMMGGQGQMMGGQGQMMGGAQRMSPRERALLKAQEAEKESEDAVEEFLAAVDKGDKKKMGTLVSKRSRGILKRLQDGSISDDDFNRVVEMYQDGKVGESTAASRSSERTVSVELPDRRRRVKVRAESDSWLISSLDGVR
jgi:hypothetical protein